MGVLQNVWIFSQKNTGERAVKAEIQKTLGNGLNWKSMSRIDKEEC